MDFKKFSPSDSLKQYVRYYYVFRSDSGIAFGDTVFPCGDMEMIFNLGEGTWESAVENKFLKTPQIELWGQITQPLQVKSSGKHTMFGIRFRTHAAGYFLNDEIGKFNNLVSDAADIIGQPIKVLHARLLEAKEHSARIELVERFLLKRLSVNQKRSYQIDRVAGILTTINSTLRENNINEIASTHNMTSRNLNKLLTRYTGLSPKLVNKINRFQQSLRLIAKNDQTLTGIAYDCGYFDQSHFIRDFKSFTGITPSVYLENTFTVNQVFQE
jgi:AraC-like DNA-binding protein